MAITSLSLPAAGQTVGIRVDSGSPRISARVLEASAERLALIFDGKGYELMLSEGPVLLEWPAVSGLARAQGLVTGRIGRGEPFEVELVGEHETLQRRNYVRVRTMLPVVLRRPDDDCEYDGTSVDVSGGGMKVRCPEVELAIGDEVELQIWVDEVHTVPALATVVLAPHRNVFSLSFDEIAPRDRERLIEVVFVRLRRLARAERWDCPSGML